MKRNSISSVLLVAIVCASVAISSFGQTGEVYSLNVVGFQKITPVSNAMTFSAMPFDMANSRLSNVVKGLQPGGNFGSADTLFTWDKVSQRYVNCWLRTTDTNWHLQATGNPLATNVYLDPGVGFIISRPTSRTSQPVVVVAGDVVMDAAVTNTLVEGLNLISYAYNGDVQLTNLTLRWTGARGGNVGSSDNIRLWDTAAQRYVTYWLRTTDTNWHKQATGNPVASNVVIKSGEGFFYQRLTGRGNLPWVETRPYTL